MNKFNVGDRVLRTRGDFGPVKEGVVYTVEVVHSNGNIGVAGQTGCINGSFVLVEAKPTYPNPPHKHHDVIIAWAKGAEIEVRDVGSFSNTSWVQTKAPSWFDELDYRIKPVDTRKDKLKAKLEELQEAVDSVKKEIGEL